MESVSHNVNQSQLRIHVNFTGNEVKGFHGNFLHPLDAEALEMPPLDRVNSVAEVSGDMETTES
jgi:hypothetical protein